MTQQRFNTFARLTLLYTVGVILWGAYVRATGAGAGCGAHWPTCNGTIIPRAENIETLIEFSHRLTSGFLGVLIIIMLIWAWRVYPKKHMVRTGVVLSLIFVITEGAIGAGLVLFEYVADNASSARAYWVASHLVNTFILVAVLTLTVWWASGGGRLRWQGKLGWLLTAGLIGTMLIGATGAVTALGDTLFPAESLAHGLRQDFDPTAHFLVQLRIWHPTVAVAVGVFLMALANWLGQTQPHTRRFTRTLTTLVLVQLGAGVVNVLLLAPVWMQMVHLLLADLVWIVLVWLTAVALSPSYKAALIQNQFATDNKELSV
jgi:heme A synthase